MFFINKIIPFYFIISFTLGFLIIYIFRRKPKIIYKYPTPENSNNLTYKKNKKCFKYKTSKIECPLDNKDITILRN